MDENNVNENEVIENDEFINEVIGDSVTDIDQDTTDTTTADEAEPIPGEDQESPDEEVEEISIEDQLIDIKNSIQCIGGTIDYLKDKYSKIEHERCNHGMFHHKGNGYHRHPAEVEITYTEGKYTNSKLIKSIYSTYDKNIKVKVPKDKNHKKSSIYFIDFPIGLTETCHSKYHNVGSGWCDIDKDYEISKNRFFRYLNKLKHTHLKPDDFELSLPRKINHGKYNTEITLSPKRLSGYNGDIVLRYRREKIEKVFRHYVPSDDKSSLYLSEYIIKLDLPLLSVDYKDKLLPEYDPDFPDKAREVDVVAKETSLFYYGSTTISINNRRIYFNVDGSINEELSDGFHLTESEKNKAKDIVMVDTTKHVPEVVIYRDGSMKNRGYTLDLSLKAFSNVEIDDVTLIAPNSGFEINNDRYCFYGIFIFKYKDTKDVLHEVDCNSIIVDRNFTVLLAENNLFGLESYDPSKVAITSTGKVATISKDEEDDLTYIYYHCTDGHILSTVAIEKDSGIRPIRIYKGNNDSLYVVSEIVDNQYKIYKILMDGSLVTFRDSENNLYPYKTITVKTNDLNIAPGMITEIIDHDDMTYLAMLSPGNYDITGDLNLLDNENYTSPVTMPINSVWNPIKKCTEDGEVIYSFNDHFKNMDEDLISLNYDLNVKGALHVEGNLISLYTKRKSLISGLPTYGFLVMDKDGNYLGNKYIDFNESIIDEVYDIKYLQNGDISVLCNVVTSGIDKEDINKTCIVTYNKNFGTKSIRPVNTGSKLIL